MAFGKTLRKFRVEAGLSQEQLAAKAGLNRTYVGDVERGERNIAIINMQKLAKALRASLAEMLRDMEDRFG
ncbi:MAG: XRE family transcriptional regulator [Phycisphaeraceae bacterium]|nr:MAG: XRE family transcriptional regulator [Phycisphaeraceae bacterium]